MTHPICTKLKVNGKNVATLSLAIFLFSTNIVFAEYRVYQYFVKDNLTKKQNDSILVTSSLDPVSYVAYHGGNQAIGIDLLRTWICPGNTGNKRDYCDGPYNKLIKLQKSSTGAP